jgi:hypothetical protein
MKHLAWVVSLAAGACVAAPLPPLPPAAELMKAAYQNQYRARTHDALTQMSGHGEDPGWYTVTPITRRWLNPQRIVLVTAGAPAQASHAASAALSFFLLEREGVGWHVVQRNPMVDEVGSFGQLASSEWTWLKPNVPGFVAKGGDTSGGYTIVLASFYDPQANPVVPLAAIRIYSDTEGACADEVQHCWAVEGKWKMMPSSARYDDIVVDFSGWDELAPQPGAKRVRKPVSGRARYRFDGKSYRLVEGANLVPEV